MATLQQVEGMINQYVQSVGLSVEDTYNVERKAWYWTLGSAEIEVLVLIQGVSMQDGSQRYFLRVFSPLLQIPATDEAKFYRHLLELNDSKLGVKLTVMPDSDTVCATYERDINGIDYEEVRTCIADLEFWAETLDDQLKNQFSGR
ncbi:MAG: YbjN domain-containing protein [Thermonemataceae bacterium]